MDFSQRAKKLSTSATMAATGLALKRMAQGEDIILATVGEPDGDIPPFAKQALLEGIQTANFKYGSPQGLLAARQAIAKWMSALYDQVFSVEQIVISPGSKFSLFSLFFCLCDEGDEVIIPAPNWVSYETLATSVGASVRIASCPPTEGYRITGPRLQQHLTAKSRVLILNSPCNPTGAVYSKEELRAIAELVKKHPRLYVFCDDIYNQLIFSSAKRAPHLLDVCDAQTAKRVIPIHGASKSYALTGWRLGWMAAPTALAAKVTEFQSQTLTSLPDFVQIALAQTLMHETHFVVELRERIQARFLRTQQRLNGHARLKVYPSEGAFYLWVHYDLQNRTSAQVTLDLLEKCGLAVVAGIAFGCENHLRMSLTLPDDQLNEALNRMIKYFNTYG